MKCKTIIMKFERHVSHYRSTGPQLLRQLGTRMRFSVLVINYYSLLELLQRSSLVYVRCRPEAAPLAPSRPSNLLRAAGIHDNIGHGKECTLCLQLHTAYHTGALSVVTPITGGEHP